MSKIAILADSSCDLPEELAQKYDIDVMGFIMNLDGVDYLERRDCTYDEFYEKMRHAQGVPNTAAITPIQFCEQYCRYVDAGVTDVLHVTICKSGSSTYNNAVMAASMLEEERPGNKLRIHLVDSRTYSMVYGQPLCEAARKLRNGAEMRTVVEELEDIYNRSEICLAAFSLKQMKKSGRVSAAAAFAGELLGLRPIISLNYGVSKVVSKVRGNDAVPPAMVNYVRSRAGDLHNVPYLVGSTDCKEQRDALLKLCKKEFGHPPVAIFQLGGVVSCNTGPDALALTFLNSVHKD